MSTQTVWHTPMTVNEQLLIDETSQTLAKFIKLKKTIIILKCFLVDKRSIVFINSIYRQYI